MYPNTAKVIEHQVSKALLAKQMNMIGCYLWIQAMAVFSRESNFATVEKFLNMIGLYI